MAKLQGTPSANEPGRAPNTAILSAWLHTANPGAVHRSEFSTQGLTAHAAVVGRGITLRHGDAVDDDCRPLRLVLVSVLA